MPIPLITLLTDFGWNDGYPGVMKGVIWGICPQAKIADLTHSISPQNIFEGALALERCAPYFPSGTVHIAVVDPGVGTSRRPIAARIGEHYFVGPDNGLMTLLHRRFSGSLFQVVQLDRPQYHLSQMSSSFHGRDLFAPVGAHLANGVPLVDLGTSIADPVLIDIPSPQRLPNGWQGEVIHVDSFGNLATNLTRHHIGDAPNLCLEILGKTITGLASTFGEGAPGDLITMFDSSGYLAIAVVNCNAARELECGIGTRVLVTLH